MPRQSGSVFLARTCVGCDRTGSVLCRACAEGLLPPAAVSNQTKLIDQTGLADQKAPGDQGGLMDLPDGVDVLVAAFSYAGMGRRLVLGLKAGGRRDLVPLMVAALAAHIPVELGADPPSVVTWAPTTARRRRDRGFDQARLLARGLGARQGWPVRRALVRTGTTSQVGHDRAARAIGPGFRPCRGLSGSVIVVDDVVTTGATMAAAARALRLGGARRVVAVVVALTPLKVAPR